jgi:hypothetical protein
MLQIMPQNVCLSYSTISHRFFGIATVFYLHILHDKLNELKTKDDHIAHSFANELTYVKSLDYTARVNSDTILNLCTILKNKIFQSQDKHQQIIRDTAW